MTKHDAAIIALLLGALLPIPQAELPTPSFSVPIPATDPYGCPEKDILGRPLVGSFAAWAGAKAVKTLRCSYGEMQAVVP